MTAIRSLITCALLAVLVPVAAPSALAQQGDRTDSYCAFLSDADHHNSRGVKLTTAGQVLRQDRANFHKFGIRDEWDESDPLYGDARNREILEMTAEKGLIPDQIWDYIVNNETYVCVEAYIEPGKGARINVIIPE